MTGTWPLSSFQPVTLVKTGVESARQPGFRLGGRNDECETIAS